MRWMLPECARPPRQRSGADAAEREAVENETSAAPRANVPVRTGGRAEAESLAPGSGASLPEAARLRMEERFGRSFGDVRVHTGTEAAEAARRFGAMAFTAGRHIVFGRDRFQPGEPEGEALLGHELSHVVQQGGDGAVQRQAEPELEEVTGSPAGTQSYVLNPTAEADPSLSAALRLLRTYEPEVKLDKVEFRELPSESQKSQWLSDRHYGGDSFWDGAKPVVRLPKPAMDVIAKRNAATATPDEVHPVVQTIGHELYHLWRIKKGVNASNPVNAPYEKEASRRMEAVRANWLDQIQNNPHERRRAGIAKDAVVKKWEDIPEKERAKIEEDAAQTSYIKGLHESSSYLVEELYAKIEEISYIRIQQTMGDARTVARSRAELTELARMVYLIHNNLKSVSGPDQLVTPEILASTEKAILAYLRKRYPNKTDPAFDSFEVLFYLSAVQLGMPVIIGSDGRLQSKLPEGARMKPVE